MPLPDPSEYAPYHTSYIAYVSEDDIVGALKSDLEATLALLRDVSEEEAARRHPPYTWSTKEVVGHVTDTERVFGYRALCFARGDATPLPGFDENAYAKVAQSDLFRLSDLVTEFEMVRRSNIAFFANLPETAWSRSGTANGSVISVRAMAYIMVGHHRHHLTILRKRLTSSLDV